MFFRFTIFLMFSCIAPLSVGAQSIHLQPIKTVVRGYTELGSRQIPLPPGDWVLVAKSIGRSTGAQSVPIAYVYLAQIEKDIINRWIFASTNLESSPGGWTRGRETCDRTDVHHNVSDRNYSAIDSSCWSLNHISMTLTSQALQVHRDFFDFSTPLGRPTTSLANVFYIVKQFDFLGVQYHSNPEASGFERPVNSDWRGNPWHRDSSAGDSRKQAYIANLKDEGEKIFPLVRIGFDRKLPLPQNTTPPNANPQQNSAPPTNAAPHGNQRDAETRIRELNRLRDGGLITPQEYESRRKAVLDGL